MLLEEKMDNKQLEHLIQSAVKKVGGKKMTFVTIYQSQLADTSIILQCVK